MKRSILLSFFLFTILLFGCSNVDPQDEFVKSAFVNYGGDTPAIKKIVFENDGNNYTRGLFYWANSNGEFKERPDGVFDMLYDEEGFISEVLNPASRTDNTIVSKYIFNRTANSLQRTYWRLNDQDILEEVETKEQFHMKDPVDGYYIFNDILYEYKSGNVVGVGSEVTDDLWNLDALGKKWNFWEYLYDDEPNFFSSYATYTILGIEMFELSRNKNNQIGMRYGFSDGGNFRTWKFTRDKKGRVITYEFTNTGITFNFQY